MFERFTDRARRVIVLAQEEARMLNHDYIGTEHILLGLIHEAEGVAYATLESLGVSLQNARAEVEEVIGQGQRAASGHIPFTPRAKKVLELALREALDLGHNYIGTEHILLGLIREGEGVGAQVLTKLGATLDQVREQVIALLDGRTIAPEEIGGVYLPTPQMALTPRAGAVLALSEDFARKTGQRRIQPAHLLMGMVAFAAGDQAARDMLREIGIDLDEVQRRIDELSSPPDDSDDQEGQAGTEESLPP
jgi:ATP-dependent Clp protease ATP-binding subunit ClpA